MKNMFTIADNNRRPVKSERGSCKLTAFTLAETLITLGIIGVVAAITMPSVIQHYKEKQTVTALKHFNSVMNQAFERAKLEYGDPDTWSDETGAAGAEKFMSKIKPYLKLLKDCKDNTDDYSCRITGSYKSLSGVDCGIADSGRTTSDFILADGGIAYFHLNSKTCKYKSDLGETPQLKNICGGLHFDINGNRGPNVKGKDWFLFFITKYGIVPAGTAFDKTEYAFSNRCKRNDSTNGTYAGTACAAWVIYNENMDYLHCDDLSWEGKRSCK